MHPRRFARNASHERSCFWRITTQPHPKNSIVAPVVPRLMGSDPGRPVKTHGPPHGPGEAAHIEPTSHGPRPGPAHQFCIGRAAARPGPSNFRGRAAARHNFQIGPARPGLDKRTMTSPRKNRGVYGFEGASLVLITMDPRNTN